MNPRTSKRAFFNDTDLFTKIPSSHSGGNTGWSGTDNADIKFWQYILPYGFELQTLVTSVKRHI
ncbi:TPA: hypothetical protein EYM26_13460 [Candidatus Poribacteria bacterium]|nr:hypothetical protein [Candidatus Poribacteria bacterium]HIN28228.1 hypothetical protein [Candidatus Poribacteria bacterium]HIO81264.1 hypothetical protein [Candidatus Poribacteria bacterium]